MILKHVIDQNCNLIILSEMLLLYTQCMHYMRLCECKPPCTPTIRGPGLLNGDLFYIKRNEAFYG